MKINPNKVYVDVDTSFNRDGQMLPRRLTWEDGKTYPIDRVKAVRAAHAERAGGQGDRYTIVVGGRETYLFFERNPDQDAPNIGKWFVERRTI